MNFNGVVSAARTSYHATTTSGQSVPLMVWGPPGVGKSAAIYEAAKQEAARLGLKGVWLYGSPRPAGDINDWFGFVDKRAGQMDPVDAGGFPKYFEENDTMRRVMEAWYPHYDRTDMPAHGIVFLDEITSAPPSVQASLFQLLQDLRLGDKALKKGWSNLAAGNRMSDGGVTFKMATPLANRLVHVEMTSDIDGYTAWGMDTGVLPLDMVAFLRFRPNLLNTFEEHIKKKLDGHAFATERTWHKLADLQQVVASPDLWMPLAGGLVGQGPAAEYLAFKSVWDKMPSIDSIFDTPETAIVPDENDSATLYAVATAISARADKQNAQAVVTYLDRMPKAFAVLCVMDAQRRQNGFLYSAAFSQWAARNAKLFG